MNLDQIAQARISQQRDLRSRLIVRQVRLLVDSTITTSDDHKDEPDQTLQERANHLS